MQKVKYVKALLCVNCKLVANWKSTGKEEANFCRPDISFQVLYTRLIHLNARDEAIRTRKASSEMLSNSDVLDELIYGDSSFDKIAIMRSLSDFVVKMTSISSTAFFLLSRGSRLVSLHRNLIAFRKDTFFVNFKCDLWADPK